MKEKIPSFNLISSFVTVLGCKENIDTRIFLDTQRFSSNLTLFCYYYIPYFIHKSRINADLSS